MCLKNLLGLKGQSSSLQMDSNLSFQIDISTLKARIPTNEVSMFKLIIEERLRVISH